MGTDTRDLIIDDHGLLENWSSFLGDQANSFESKATQPTGASPARLICKVTDLWGVEFDSDAFTSEFPLLRSHTNGSLVLPLTNPWTLSQKLTDVLTQFGVSQDGQILGDDGVLGPSDASAPGLVADIAQSFDSQVFKINTGGRNAIWLTPGQVLRSDVALTLAIDGPNDPALNVLTKIANYYGIPLPGANAQINDFSIIIQRTRLGIRTQQDGQNAWLMSKTFRITFRLVLNSFTFWLTSQATGLSFYVTQDLTQTGDLLSLTPEPVKSIGSVIDNSFLSNLKLVQLSAGKRKEGIWWRVILALQLHTADIYFEYESLSQTFSGGLIVGDLKDPDDPGVVLIKGFYASSDSKSLPTFEPGKDLEPPGGVVAPLYKQMYLGDLSDTLKSLPSSLPTAIALASIAYAIPDGGSPGTLWFAARLIQPPDIQQPNHKVPSPFNWSLMDVRLQLVGGTVQDAELATQFTLTDVAPSTRVALLGLRFKYSAGIWELSGSVQDLSISMLWQFFDPNVKDGLLKILGKIVIAKLTVKYTYDTNGAATDFLLDGTVDIGKLGLQMTYEHTEAGWKFEFKAGSSDGTATLQDVLNSIVDSAGNDLPSFVAGIKIPAVSGDDSPISITVQKGSDLQGSSSTDDRLFFAFHISIDEHFKLSMVQVTNADGSQTKRIVRFAVDKIPLIPKVPLLEKLPQPFDELEYMWVDSEGDGWKESEIKDINKGVLTGSDQLAYKPLSGTDKDGKQQDGAADIVIKPGHHFVVLNKGAVVLDHNFSASGTPPGDGVTSLVALRNQTAHRSAGIRMLAADSPTPSTNAPTKGDLTFTFGPLTISAIALHYQEQGGGKVLALTIDATFDFNPITFTLIGFGIGISLNGLHLSDLSSVADHLVVELHGLSFSFDKTPLLIAGGFEHDFGPSGEEIYKGDIGVSFPPYTFVGLGEYAIFQNYKSVFIYAKLDGPLITLGFATISGIRLGMGYNSSVRMPKLEEITSFPFVDDHSVSGTGNDPMKILQAMTATNPAWVTPTQSSYWFAAGLSLVAFDILTVTAVAMVQFKEAGLDIAIIADAVAQMPPSVTSRSEMIAYIELGFICEMNMADGYFRVEAALAPTSFLLVPACRIYGGMALVYWFNPNAHAGDWVFTVGGYHPKFQKPDWYPTVQRLGISFSIGSCLQVTGETYFAVTPKAAMGGALIHVTLTVGPVSAWLDAGFDALVNFHPLHYIVDFHVAVGVAFDADVWFVHIHISATVGAWLEVQGPEFGGTAHVDFCMFSFDVDFGASPHGPPPMNLPEFWRMLHKPGPNVESQNTNDNDPPQSLLSYVNNSQPAVQERNDGAAILFSLEDGNFPMPHRKDSSTSPTGGSTSTGVGSKWFVKGGSLRFRVNCDFAISKATVTNTTVIAAPTGSEVYSRPMHVDTAITSELTVTVKRVIDSSVQGSWKTVVADMKLMPHAAFGKYDASTDPSNASADTSSLLSGDPGLVNLMMGVVVSAPLPILAESRIGLILNATNMMLAGIKDFRRSVNDPPIPPGAPDHGKDWLLPPWEPAQVKYLPAPLSDAEKAANQERWDSMRTTWSALESKQTVVTDETDGILAQCNDIFGWQKTQLQIETAPPAQPPADGTPPVPTPGDTVTPQPWRLTGKLPMKLINSLEVRYLDLPRIAVV